jgi:hypothetical protein
MAGDLIHGRVGESPRVDFTPTGKPVTHGGPGTAYVHYGCRCDECREANTRRKLRADRNRWLRMTIGESEPSKHGKVSTYTNWGCRCEPCTTAQSQAYADYRRH